MTVFLHITAGTGPRECAWVVKRLCAAMAREARATGLELTVLENDCEEGSARVEVRGPSAGQFARSFTGTIQWIGQSPFRPRHKRRNWFVGVSQIETRTLLADLKDSDIRYSAMKAGGPGGQHVNTANSAVRAVHLPTGITVTAREERSQHANRRLCRIKIAAALESLNSENLSSERQREWKNHRALERGNAVRIYEGDKFRLR